MVTGVFSEEFESTISALRLWKAGILDNHTLLPKLIPEVVTSIDFVEGTGGVGTIKQFNFTPVVPYKYMKDRLDVIDHEKLTMKYTVIEGGHIGIQMKWYTYELKFEDAVGGGSVSKVTVEYETLDDTPLTEEEEEKLVEGMLMMLKAVEGYLQANPDAYV